MPNRVDHINDSLPSRQIEIGFIKSTDDINVMLKGSGLEKYFEVIVASDHVPKGKPDPSGYTLALEKLNQTESDPIPPSQTAAIEDSHWGIEAANAAGMHTVAVAGTYSKEELTMADMIVESMNELNLAQLSRHFD